MTREIEGRLFKVNTYGSCKLVEISTYENSDEAIKMLNELQLDCVGIKLELFIYLAELAIKGCIILSVTEFNTDGSKPKVAYAGDKDYKKIYKYLSENNNK